MARQPREKLGETMNFKYDPTITLGQVGSAIIVLLTGMAGYYDLKSDVRLDKNTAELRLEQQKLIDANQDRRLDEVKNTIEKNTAELKLAIKDIVNPRVR